MIFAKAYNSPLGKMSIETDGDKLTGLYFEGQKYYVPKASPDSAASDGANKVFDTVSRWLDIYYSGGVPDFTPEMNTCGSAFQQLICEILLAIPYGSVTTYGRIAEEAARRMGRERMSAQAAGGAIGHNPICLIIPCHRVIASDGSLTGYAGGIERKAALLRLEGIKLADSGTRVR